MHSTHYFVFQACLFLMFLLNCSHLLLLRAQADLRDFLLANKGYGKLLLPLLLLLGNGWLFRLHRHMSPLLTALFVLGNRRSLLTVLFLLRNRRHIWRGWHRHVVFRLRRIILPFLHQWTVRNGGGLLHRLLLNCLFLLLTSRCPCLPDSMWFPKPCVVHNCNYWPRSLSNITLPLPLRLHEHQLLPLLGPRGRLRRFPRGAQCQASFTVTAINNDPANWCVRRPSQALPQLFAQVVNLRVSLLCAIRRLQKGKNR